MKSSDSTRLNWENKKQATLNILAYSDVFNYPLTLNELYDRGKLERNELEICLTDLTNDRKIFLIENFYSLHDDDEVIKKRKKRNSLANKFMVYSAPQILDSF